MSEKPSAEFENHVEMCGEVKKRTMTFRISPHLSAKIQNAIEVIGAFLWVMMVLWIEIGAICLYFYIFFKGGIIGKLFCIWYATHFYNDRKSAENGARGQGSEYIRTLSWYRNFSNYFPVSVVKTAELPPTKNYLFAAYPHGVISVGMFCNFATSTTNFRELFPKIRSKLVTLNYHFFVPLYRELTLSWGMISAKPESIYNALTQSNNKLAVSNYDGYTSNAVVLVVGGAQEALYARPSNYRIVLNKRKGFVKIAIQTGASLVPVISFGEVDIFDQPPNEPGSKIRAYQDFVKKWTGVAPALFYGRGFSEKSSGLIPYRRPITTVIGAPIDVAKNPNPTREEVDQLHATYVEELIKLFETHKEKYIKNHENVKLQIE